MKKLLITLLAAAMLFSLPVSAFAADPVTVKVDGITLKTDVNPVIQNNRVLVPVRIVGQSLGAKIDWSNTEKNITVTTENGKIMLNVNSQKAVFTEANTGKTQNYTLDCKPVIKQYRVLVPLRFVSEQLGADVNYKNRTVSISAPDLTINGQKIAAFTAETYMTMGSRVDAFYGNNNIKNIYNMLCSARENQVKAPEKYGRYGDYDEYYLRTSYCFLQEKAKTGSDFLTQKKMLEYDIYDLPNIYDSDNNLLTTPPAGYSKMLLHDLKTDCWYNLNEEEFEKISSIIYYELWDTDMRQEIFNNIV